jgi:hypothetical protein
VQKVRSPPGKKRTKRNSKSFNSDSRGVSHKCSNDDEYVPKVPFSFVVLYYYYFLFFLLFSICSILVLGCASPHYQINEPPLQSERVILVTKSDGECTQTLTCSVETRNMWQLDTNTQKTRSNSSETKQNKKLIAHQKRKEKKSEQSNKQSKKTPQKEKNLDAR